MTPSAVMMTILHHHMLGLNTECDCAHRTVGPRAWLLWPGPRRSFRSTTTRDQSHSNVMQQGAQAIIGEVWAAGQRRLEEQPLAIH